MGRVQNKYFGVRKSLYKKAILDNKVRLAHSYILLTILSACGGSRPENGKDAENFSSSGYVIDGYISGARVFRDVNGNNRFDLGEDFAITNSSGYFSGLNGSEKDLIVVDDNNGFATDTVTGFPLSFTMSSPGDYTVITPVTTLVVAMQDKGFSLSEAENAVTSVLGLPSNIDLDTFDPFSVSSSDQSSSSEAYKTISVKIANVLMASDNDFGSNSVSSYDDTLANFAMLIETKHSDGKIVNFDSVDDLRTLLPSVATSTIYELAGSHAFDSYLEVLDGQLLFLAANYGGVLRSNTQYGDELVSVHVVLSVSQTIDPSHDFKATLLNTVNGKSAISTDLVSSGSKVAIFRFSDTDIRSLGDGLLDIGLEDLTTGNTLDVLSEITLQVMAATDSPPPPGPIVAAASVSTPANLVSDEGIVADGYISGARVFRDENENETFDAGESFVTTNASGEFTGLGGSADKPIVADGNNGTAVDTSTGSVFNAVLSAPAGSKVVNPVTTIVNELMQDSTSGVTTVAEANLKVAQVFGMEAVTSAGIDFTKFDPISKKTFADDGTSTAIADNNLADITQGVATFVANLIVSGASEKSREAGGDATVLANTTKAIIGNIKDMVKTKSTASAQFDYSNATDIRDAMGADLFDATSTTLSTVGDSFSAFNPKSYVDSTSNTSGLLDQTALLEKQILSQSEFGDGVLTTSEASDGSTYVVGPISGDAVNGVATIRFSTTEVVRYKTVNFSNSKYATVELDAPTKEGTQDNILKDISGGSIGVAVKLGSAANSTEWDSLGDSIFSETTYFHKNIVPTISFTNGGMTPVSGKTITASDAGSTIALSGNVTINLGSSTAPVKLNKIVAGLSSNDGDDGRSIVLEILNSKDETVFSKTTTVTRSNDSSSATTGSENFAWSINIAPSTASETSSKITFAELADGSYKIRGKFVDAYGASSSDAASVYNSLTLDRNAPEISGTPTFSRSQVNATDRSVDLVIGLTEAASSRTTAQNNLIDIIDSSSTGTRTLTQAIAAGDASATFNSDQTQLTINYTPSGEGTLSFNIKPGAFVDSSGNGNTNGGSSSPLSTSTIAFDFDAPALASSNGIVINNGSNTITSSNHLNTTDFDAVNDNLQLVVTFDSPVTSFSKDDVAFSKISNQTPLQVSGEFTASNSNQTWTAKLLPASSLEGTTSVSVANNSYTDLLGNTGAGGSANFAVDTRPPQIFSAALDPSTEKTRYGISDLGVSDKIDIIVTFDEALSAFSGSPRIQLGGFSDGNPRYATLTQSSVNGLTSLKFSYSITTADRASSGVDVAGLISNGAFTGVNGNPVSLDLTSINPPLDLSSKAVDGSMAGSVVDGYVEGGIIFADNDGNSQLSASDPIAQADATGGFEILGATGALVLEGGFDISTNKDFNVRYSAPSGYSVINPVTTLIIEETNSNLSLSNIARAESTIYNTIGAPLGSDATSNPSFAITPSAVSGDGVLTPSGGTWSSSDVGKYISGASGEALLLDTSGSYRIITNFAEGTTEIASGSWSLVDKKSGLLKSYNAYEAIAEASEGTGNVSVVKGVVDQALDYQKVAASVALIVDVLSTAASSVSSENRSAADVSNDIFAAINTNLTAIMTAINSGTAQNFYPGNPPTLSRNINDALIATVSQALKNIFEPTGETLPVPAISAISADFTEIYDILATAIVGIHSASSKELNAYNDGAGILGTATDETSRLAVSEDGINALTEIVQVQSVVQGDITSEIVDFYGSVASGATSVTPSQAGSNGQFTRGDGLTWDAAEVGYFIIGNGGVAKLSDVDGNYEIIEAFSDGSEITSGQWSASSVNPRAISVDRLLGVSNDPSNTEPVDYVDVPVGTVVPIRYNIEEPASFSKFEGDANGVAAEFSFVITRAGSIKTTSSLEYEIFGSISTEDISGGNLSGELFFDVNEKQKTLNITLNNDTLREPDETLSVRIFDPTETSQVVNDLASVIIRDDDPSTPEIAVGRTSYSVSEGRTVIIDDLNLDYFDTDAKFKIETNSVNGALSTAVGSSSYTEGEYVSYFDLQTGLLRNLEFSASSSPTGTEAVSIITISASETGNSSDLGRVASETLEVTYDIHRLPTVDVASLNTGISNSTFYAGLAQSIPGITVSDVDSEFLTVTVSSDVDAKFTTTSSYSMDTSNANSVRISGSILEVQNVLDGLAFTATSASANGATLTVSVDDDDPLHERSSDGALSASSTTANANAITILASPPSLKQGFEPKLTVDSDPNSNVWGSFPGIEVEDVDSETVDFFIFGNIANVDFRLYDKAISGGSLVAASTSVDETRLLKLTGSPLDISKELKLLQVEIQQKQTGLAEILVTDGNTTGQGYPVTLTPSSSNQNGTFSLGGSQTWNANDVGKIIVGNGGLAKLLKTDGSYQIIQAFADTSNIASGNWGTLSSSDLSYTPIDNIVPEPGGTVLASAVVEDTQTTITVSGINLVDGDAFLDDGITPELPTHIQILSVQGGNIAGISTGTGEPINLSVADLSDVTTSPLIFTPDSEFNGTAVIDYVVVDPEQSTYTSAVSEILVPVSSVNDKPLVTLSNKPIVFEQGQAPIAIFENVAISDVDGAEFSQLKVVANLDQSLGDQQLIAPTLFGITPETQGSSNTQETVLTYTGSMSLANIATILSNIKFNNTSQDVRGQTRNFDLILRDADPNNPLESDPVTKTVSLLDVNDAPSLVGGEDSAEFTEASSGAVQTSVAMSTFGVISDPEADSVSQIKVKISSGYRLGQDILEYSGPASINTSTSSVQIKNEFDASIGQITLNFTPNLDLSSLTSNILENITYTNTSEDPNVADRKITISVTDQGGASSISSIKTIKVSATNDAPNLFSLALDAEVTSGLGEQFIEGGRAVKVASDLFVRDVDTRLMDSATITSSAGVLDLSTSGTSLASAFGITIDKSVQGVLSLTRTDGIQVDELQSVLREVTIGGLSRQEGEDTSTQSVTISVVDALNATSNIYTSNVKILAAPSVQVVDVTGASGDYTDIPAGVAKVLKFNDTFAANELFVNLEQSSIRTELGRFIYDTARNTNKLTEAQHLDLREMSSVSETGGATTNIIGQANADVIYGSVFSDFVDGSGGDDIIRTGAGNDFVSLRTGSKQVLDGGDGSDTLILPSAFSGSLDLSNISFSDITISGFENVDARSAIAQVSLSGSAEANILLGGSANDTIKLGQGGDKVEGGSGDDIFEVDVDTIPLSGSTIRDLKPNDIIKLTSSGADYTLNRWLGLSDINESDVSSSDEFTDGWLSYDSNIGKYFINIETSGGVKKIDIGPDIFGTPGKWVYPVSDSATFSMLQPELNAQAVFGAKAGPITTVNKPLLLQANTNGSGYKIDLDDSSATKIEVLDPDNAVAQTDNLTVTISVDGANPNIIASVSGYGDTTSGAISITGTQSSVNTALGTLSVSDSGSGRGIGTFSVTVSDGYTPATDVITKTFTFEVPNSAPVMTLGTLNSIYNSALQVGTTVSLGQTGLLSPVSGKFISDDLRDLQDNAVELKISFDGAVPLLPSASEYVNVIGSDVFIKHDATSSFETDWAATLEALASGISFERTTVGSVQVEFSLKDGLGAGSNTSVKTFSFAPRDLEAPQLNFALYPGQTEAPVGEIQSLGGAQFDGANIRLFLLDDEGTSIGASVGDTLKLDVTLTDGENTFTKSITKLIPATAQDPARPVPFIDLSAVELLPEGATRNGTFVIETKLIPTVAPTSTSAAPSISFIVDSTAPNIPDVLNVIPDVTYHVVNGEVTNFTVNGGAEDLELAVTRIYGGPDNPWYSLPTNLNIKPLGTGKFAGEVTPTNVSSDGQNYSLSFASSLADGVYAVVARDAVLNVSDVNVSSFNLEASALPRGIFVIDNDLAAVSLGYTVKSTDATPTDNYKVYKHNGDEATAIILELGENGGQLPTDIVNLVVEAWGGISAPDTSLDPDISGTFTRSFPGDGSWASSGEVLGVSLTGSNTLQPTITLDTGAKLDVLDDRVTVKISATDRAGNTVSIFTLDDEIQLDRTADGLEDGAVNTGLVTSLVDDELLNGVSVSEAASLTIDASGFDKDVVSNTTHFITATSLVANLKNLGQLTLEDLTADANPITVDGKKMLAFNSGAVYLDLENTAKVSSTFIKDVSLGSLTKIPNIDISTIIPSAGSADEQLFVIHELRDQAGNVSFRSDFLPSQEPNSQVFDVLRLDVKPAAVLEGIEISDASDSGLKGDLVTSSQRPEITFITDEKIRIDGSITLEDGLSNPRLVNLSTLTPAAPSLAYDLVVLDSEEISLTGGGVNYKYTAVLDENITLSHGVWGVEVTDLAGNVSVSDGSAVLDAEAPYFANSDLNSEVDGVILVDLLSPPDPTISIAGVEREGGFLNSTESTSSVEITIIPGVDTSSADPVTENQVASIVSIELDGTILALSENQVSSIFDAASSDLIEGLHTITVTSKDIADNITVTDYTFVKDTIAAEQSTKISVTGIGTDKVINKYEYSENLVVNLEPNVLEDFVTSVTLLGVGVNQQLELIEGGPILNAQSLSLSDGNYDLEVVTSDPAGNLRTDIYNFQIDTVVAERPILKIEGINGGLNYWETLEGLRVSLDVVSGNDRIFEDEVVMSSSQLVSKGLSVEGVREGSTTKFHAARDLLVEGENKLKLRVEDEFFNDEIYEYTFDAILEPASGVTFSIINNLVENSGEYELEYDIYLTEQAVLENIADPSAGLGVDVFVKMPSGMGNIDPATIAFATEFDVQNSIYNLDIEDDSIFISAFTTDIIPVSNLPLVSFSVDLPDGWVEFDGQQSEANEVKLSLINLSAKAVSDVIFHLDTTDLIIQDLII